MRLHGSGLELEIFLDAIDEASARMRLGGAPEGAWRSYEEVLRERLGSDSGLPEALGGWVDGGFQPTDAPRMFAAIAETLPGLVERVARETA